MKRPNFFILGAPKCGTTSLAAWLAEHPAAFVSPIKEPHFFATDNYRSVDTLERYLDLYAGAGERHLAVGEASTWYLYSRVAVSNILAFAPEARFVVCLRNPVEMAPSLHEQEYVGLNEDVPDFETAWKLIPERRAGRSVPGSCRNVGHLLYDEACALGSQLERLYQQVPRERVHVVLLDELGADPGRAYRGVLAHLGLPDEGRTEFPRLNAAKEPRWRPLSHLFWLGSRLKTKLGVYKSFGFQRMNLRPRPRTAPSPEMTRVLRSTYAMEISKLEDLLGRSLRPWRDSGAKAV